ncbi:MAG: winged helix-turn-helix domain-containing protein [Nitrospiraceae bacterium]
MLNSGQSNARQYRFDDVTVDCGNFNVQKCGRLRALTPRAFDVLLYLMHHQGRVVSKQELFERIWNEQFVTDNALTQLIKEIRQAIGDDASMPRYIETVHKRGYRFIVPIEAFTETKRPAEKVMLAVLPFQNLDGNVEDEYFSDGLTEEMITQLGRLFPQRLGVIARTSVMPYKRADRTISQVGSELGVDYVLEGSVRREGEGVRISAQLIQVRDQTHLWAESFDRDLRDILVMQGEVARAIADAIKVTLTPEERTRLADARPVNPKAHVAHLKGRYLWNNARFKESIEYFQEAIEMESTYAAPYVGLADSYILLGDSLIGGLPSEEAMARAKTAAMKALDIEGTLAEAHASLAIVTWRHRWEWLTAGTRFQRALELNPSCAIAHLWYAWYLSAMERHDEALAEIKRAQELDPLSPVINMNAGWVPYFARQYDQAIEQLRKTLEMEANFFGAYLRLGFTYLQKGMYEEAIAACRKAAALSGDAPLYVASSLGYVYGMTGERSAALKVLDELTGLSKQRYVPADLISWVHIGLGEKDQAFEWLEKASEERCSYLAFLKVDAIFDPLRNDPRFQDLLRRMNFPE